MRPFEERSSAKHARRRASHRSMPPRLAALATFVVVLAGCGSSSVSSRPSPPPGPAAYDGQLVQGKLVRAIVEVYDEHNLAAVHRIRRGHFSVEFVTFPKAPDFVPAEGGGTMVVLRSLGTSSFHTPDDASGAHYWFDEHACELVRVEMTARNAIAAARACLEHSGDSTAYDLDKPFASGPSAAGRWIVHFEDRAALAKIPRGIELEVGETGACKLRPLR
jgi:hypothetical protein